MSIDRGGLGTRFCAGLGILLLASGAAAETRPPGLPPVVGAAELYSSNDRTGLGLLGFDPVSYFLAEGPTPGFSAHEVLWNGTAWRFASEANREAFARDPDTYAPRIGGYDAPSAARGVVVDADPTIFALRSGRLYVFRNDRSRRLFLADDGVADQAEARWPALQQGLVHP